MRSIRAIALPAVLSLLSISVLGAEPAEEKTEADRLFDDFDGKLALDWKQIRTAPTHQSLTKSPGKLTITTQYGSIHRTGRPELAKNLFLIDLPERDQADFVVTTILDAFRPQMPYNQAGLLIYKDDDNYLKHSLDTPVRASVRHTNVTSLSVDPGVSLQDIAVGRGLSYHRLWSPSLS